MATATPAQRAGATRRIREPFAVARWYLSRTMKHVLSIAVGLILMIPFAWAAISSLKPVYEIRLLPPVFWPSQFMWSNYVEVWATSYFTNWVGNSVFITVAATTGAVLSASAAGYAFARFRFPGRDILFGLTLATMMLPYEVTLIPSYLMYYLFGWLNTFLPLIVPSWLGGGAFLIFLFRQFFMTLPVELDEAAKIDGASYFQILGRIVLPLSLPVLATAAILALMSNWNSFIFPLIILNDTDKFTLSIGLRYFAISLLGAGATSDAKPLDHLLLAGSIMMTIPIIVIFFFGQRYFVQGVVMTGIKG